MNSELEALFDKAMLDIYRRAKTEAEYDASCLLQMLTEHRGLETARVLLRTPTVSEEYTALWERGRLDLTVEALIFDFSEFQPLFTPEELEVVRERLRQYKYPPILDPLEPFIGTLHTDVPNWSLRHHELLGESLREEMTGGDKRRTGS